jgi:hypothetical protein
MITILILKRETGVEGTFTAAKVGIRREFDEVVCKHEANRAFITFAHHTTPP